MLPPMPAARPLDSIFRCRFMLPDGHPDAWREGPKAAKSKVGWIAGSGWLANWLPVALGADCLQAGKH